MSYIQQCPCCNSVMSQQGTYMICDNASCQVKLCNRAFFKDEDKDRYLGEHTRVPDDFQESYATRRNTNELV